MSRLRVVISNQAVSMTLILALMWFVLSLLSPYFFTIGNISDITLQTAVIGIIAAGVLLLVFASGMAPSLKIGDAEFKPTTVTWQMVLVIGFVAGFLERLVPDLLDKRYPQGNGTTAPRS